MKKNKELLFVILSTLILGGLSLEFIEVPFMGWGFFGMNFIVAFILSMLYSTSLYLLVKVELGINKVSCVMAVLFGFLSTCLKMGLDAILTYFAKDTGSNILILFIMEIGILIWGSILIFFLQKYVAKRKFVWNKSLSNAVFALVGIAFLYLLIILFYQLMFKIYIDKVGILNIFGEMEEEKNIFYMSWVFSGRLGLIGTIIYIVFFILLWRALQKNAQAIGDSKESQELEE